MADAHTFAGETLVQEIPLGVIFPDAAQVRRKFDEEALQQLADSISEHGVIQPIVVRPTDKTGVAPFEIIAGERRWRASQMAGRETIPAVIRKDLIGQDVSVLQILENLQRADLTLQETAAGVAKLVEAIGNTSAAKQLGKSEGWVSKHARIGALPEDVRALVEAGAIESADLAHELGQVIEREGDSYWARQLLERASTGTLTRADTRHRLDAIRAEEERQKAEAQRIKEAAKRDKEIKASPEFAAKQEKLEAAERERKKNMDAAQAAHKAREAAIDALASKCHGQLLPLIPVIERALGVTAGRNEDGDLQWDVLALDDGYDDHDGIATRSVFAIEPLTPAYWAEGDVPDSPEAIRYRVAFTLDYRQLMQLIKAIAPGKAPQAESPEKQGELTVSQFLAEQTVREKGTRTKAADLYAGYAKWCRKNRLDALPFTGNSNAWGEAIAAAGIDKHRLKTGWHYLGVALKD